MLGLIRKYFGTNLEQIWDMFGYVLDHAGTLFGQLLDKFGLCWDNVGTIHVGAMLVPIWNYVGTISGPM